MRLGSAELHHGAGLGPIALRVPPFLLEHDLRNERAWEKAIALLIQTTMNL
jgi:hypothetical protein